MFSQFRRWRLDGTLLAAHERLRAQVRATEGRDPEPSGAVIDRQTVKSTGVGGPKRDYDGAKRAKGRKRHVLVDTVGLILLACVHAANLHTPLDRPLERNAAASRLAGDRLEVVDGQAGMVQPVRRPPQGRPQDRALSSNGTEDLHKGGCALSALQQTEV